MVTRDIRLAFSERLNEALDDAGYPPKGAGRQAMLQKTFKVSQQAAGKWIEGEALPEFSRVIELSVATGYSVEWLLTGRGPKKVLSSADLVVMDDAGKVTVLDVDKRGASDDPAIKALITGHPASTFQVIRHDARLIREILSGLLAPLGLYLHFFEIDPQRGLDLQANWRAPQGESPVELPGRVRRTLKSQGAEKRSSTKRRATR